MVRRLRYSLRLAVAGIALMGAAALAQEADPATPGVDPALEDLEQPKEPGDELAQAIEQSLDNVEFQATVAPESAARDLAEQRRRLTNLEFESPDHPMLPQLTERIEAIEAEVTAALGEDEEAIEQGVIDRPGLMLAIDPPPEVRFKMREIESLQTRADREMMAGQHEAAARYLEDASSAIDEVEEQYGDQLPPGYAALIIAKERLDALRDQIADAQPAD